MRPSVRHLWLAAHRWLALGLGAVLVLAGLLGSLLTVGRPLDQALNPALFRQPAQQGQALAEPLEAARQQLLREFGAETGFTFRPPRQPGDTLWVMVGGSWEGTVYFDAAGRELGRRAEHEGWFNLLFELHSALLLGEAGKGVLTAAAAAYLLLLASGLVLWWPRRWPPSLRIASGAGALRLALDLHKVGGSVLGIGIAVSVASGAYMAWTPLRNLVTLAAGEQPLRPPQVTRAAPGAGPSLDRLVATAHARFPQARVGYVQVPAQAAQAVRVRLRLPGEPHPNGLTSVWLHPGTGEVLRAMRWDELDAGSRLVNTVYPLHSGALGGLPHQVLNALAGLLLSLLGASGLYLWWRRRALRARPAAAAQSGQRA